MPVTLKPVGKSDILSYARFMEVEGTEIRCISGEQSQELIDFIKSNSLTQWLRNTQHWTNEEIPSLAGLDLSGENLSFVNFRGLDTSQTKLDNALLDYALMPGDHSELKFSGDDQKEPAPAPQQERKVKVQFTEKDLPALAKLLAEHQTMAKNTQTESFADRVTLWARQNKLIEGHDTAIPVLDHLDLRQWDFSLTDLTGIHMNDTNLEGAIFHRTTLQFAHLVKAKLDGASILGSTIYSCNLSGTDFGTARMTGCTVGDNITIGTKDAQFVSVQRNNRAMHQTHFRYQPIQANNGLIFCAPLLLMDNQLSRYGQLDLYIRHRFEDYGKTPGNDHTKRKEHEQLLDFFSEVIQSPHMPERDLLPLDRVKFEKKTVPFYQQLIANRRNPLAISHIIDQHYHDQWTEAVKRSKDPLFFFYASRVTASHVPPGYSEFDEALHRSWERDQLRKEQAEKAAPTKEGEASPSPQADIIAKIIEAGPNSPKATQSEHHRRSPSPEKQTPSSRA